MAEQSRESQESTDDYISLDEVAHKLGMNTDYPLRAYLNDPNLGKRLDYRFVREDYPSHFPPIKISRVDAEELIRRIKEAGLAN